MSDSPVLITTKQTIHKLKLHTKWIASLSKEEKRVEIRYNDRDFQKGDVIIFLPVTPDDAISFASGMKTKHWTITHVLHSVSGLEDGYVALSIEPGLPKS